MKIVCAQPLWRQLFIAILLLLVPVLDAAIWLGFVTVYERTDELRHHTRVVALTIASYVNRDAVSLDRMVEDLAENASGRTVNPRGGVDLLACVIS